MKGRCFPTPSARGWLPWVLALLMASGAGAAGQPCLAQEPGGGQSPLSTFATKRIGDGLYAFISPDSKTAVVNGNSLLVVGDDGALVVDAGHFPAVTRSEIAEIKRLTDRPVRYLVNTHWHNDHVFGNAEYRDAFPQLTIVSTAATRQSIIERVEANRVASIRQVPGGIESFRATLKRGQHEDGTPLTPNDSAFLQADIADYTGAIAAYRQARVVAPSVTFNKELTIHLGSRTVQVMYLGLGNTAGDAVVYVPDAKVVATGDLLVAPTPYAIGSFIYEWPATMRRLMALEAATIVPGHGDIEHDWAYAGMVTRLLETVGAEVDDAVRAGLSLDSTRTRVDLAAVRQQFTHGDPFLDRSFDRFFTQPAVARAYKEAQVRTER